MKRLVRVNEQQLKRIITEAVVKILNEEQKHHSLGKFNSPNIPFGKQKDVALKAAKKIASEKGLIHPEDNGVLDPNYFSADDSGNVRYTKALPKGFRWKSESGFDMEFPESVIIDGKPIRINNGKVRTTMEEFKEKYPDEVFTTLQFKSNRNDKVTDEIRSLIADRYDISTNGYLYDKYRDNVVRPYLHGPNGRSINFRAYDVNDNEIFHGNTSIDALLMASFN